MIVYENHGFEIRSDRPDSDWTGRAKYIVPDGSALAKKIIQLHPYLELVEENGVLVDVLPTGRPQQERPVTVAERLADLEDALAELYGGAAQEAR